MKKSLVLRILLGLFLAPILGEVASAAVIPEQFIAKIYTEGLGRLPDQGGWISRTSDFNNGCTLSRVQNHVRAIFLSAEYNNLGYDNAAKVLTLYRGILNREPDSAGFNNYLSLLNSGTSLSVIVDSFLNSSEFSTLVSGAICNSFFPSYWWGLQGVLTLPVTTTGFQGGTGAQLQAVLNSTPSGGTVLLAQKSVTRITTPLVIPNGVTLSTTGSPTPAKYALMGRLVREASFNDALVKLNPGAKMIGVWVDGRRNFPTYFVQDALNVRLFGGTGTTVQNSRLDNTMGWSTLQAVGRWEGHTCGSNTLRGNLVTVYSSQHEPVQGQGYWSDGMSIACENALVENNQIVDATDVAIVLFRSAPAIQHSTVRNNTILAAGNSSYGGLVVDPLFDNGQVHDFTGSSVTNNLMWTGTRVHWDIGISVGTRAWFGATSRDGIGASVTSNTTGSVQSRADSGIAVSGMLNAFVQSNTLNVTLVNVSACPTLSVGASVSAGYASGTIQPYTNALYFSCIGH